MDKNNSQNLFTILRNLRNKIASQSRIKPFMVLHNKVLKEIADKKPSSPEELSKIKGMGQKKISQYGSILLETVKNFSSSSFSINNQEKIFSVGEYINFLNSILTPQRVVIKGEIGKISGRDNYFFFTLRDKNEEAILSCFIWKKTLDNFGVALKEGIEIKVEGYPEIFKRRGSLNFKVEHISLLGEGFLKQAFEALKKKLATSGFFSIERKKTVNKYVRRVGLITSNFSDAKDDFLTHLGKFGFKIYFHDVRVEGLYAVEDIVSAIRYFNENLSDTQVLVLTRGGGSLESLQAYNSEAIAKAIFSSRIPVVTGIGHENDETIADLVADIRASTPTDTARVISDPWRNARILLSQYKDSLVNNFFSRYQRTKDKILSVENFFNSLFKKYSQQLESIITDFFQNSISWLKFLQKKLDQVEQMLKLTDPKLRLQQGYSIVFNRVGKVIKNVSQLKIGELINLKFYRGGALSKVEKINGK